MSYKEVNEKYEKILSRFGINGRIKSVTGSAVPVQAIEEKEAMALVEYMKKQIEELLRTE